MEITNERLLQGARNLKAKGYTPEQVDSWLQTKGSSLGAIKSFVNTSKLQPLTDEQKAKPRGTNWGDIAKAGLEGFGEGIENLSNRMASGMTFGGTDWLDRHTAGSPQAKLREEVQKRADDVGFGKLNKAGELAADIYGNVKGLGGKLALGIANKGYKGLKAFLLNSSIGGGALGATSSDKLSDLLKKTIAGATLGSLFGGGMYGTGKLGQYAYNVVKPYANAPINAVENAVNKVGLGKLKELTQRASQKGRGALEVADDDVIALAQEARQKSPQAYKNFEKAVDAFNDGQAERNGAVINEAFGSKGKYENIDDLVETARKQAQPYYDKLQNIGDVAEINPQVARNIVKNPFLRKEITDVMNDPLYQAEYLGQKVLPTDWRVVDQANRSINDKISAAVRSGEADKVRLLERQKYNLLNAVDEAVPEYKVARGIYEAENKALKAQKIGENSLFDNNTSADKLKRTMKDMTDYEKASLKIGAREKLLNAVEGRENQTLGLKKLNNKQTQNKLKLVLGDKADDFINYAEDEVQAMRNLNKLTGNSNTSEKQNLRDKVNLLARIFKNPTGVVGEVGEALTSRIDNASNDLLSQMLLEQGGGRLNNAINDYVARATRAEQMRRLFAPASAVLSNEVLQIK